ncbi:MAG: IS4 family transposase [Acidobacteria bacterium]|nr:MAG: IS4 family transposase [Acidobacteriota bacterium]
MTKRDRRRQAVVSEEFEGVELGDPRRNKRAKKIADRLAAQPPASLPAAMVDRAMLEALYRHLASESGSFEALLNAHVQRSVSRVKAADFAYAVHDTTDCSFSGESRRAGLGTINAKDQGFLAHVTLAVAADGSRLPLGLLGVERIVRHEHKKTRQRSSKETRRDPKRESLRWSRGVAHAETLVGEAGRLIHVTDREGDIYRLLAEMVTGGQRFIVRAVQDRPLEIGEDVARLFDLAQETAATFVTEVPLTRRGKHHWPSKHPLRTGRLATLSFATLPLRIRRPSKHSGDLPKVLEMNAVHVFELGPPPGQPAVEWLLLTSEPITTRAEVERVVEGYRTRWTIEEYFKAVKTGCAYESRQLESYHALSNLLAYTFVVAYALLLMRALARTGRTWPATAILSDTEIEVLRKLDKRAVGVDPSVRDALLAIAALGGHVKNNGDPGWLVLSRGWQRLRDYEAGYRLARGEK